LAEVDKGVRDVIQLPELFELKPVLIRAFNAAKTSLKAATSHGDDYVSKAEFKYLIQYLRDYSNYWFVFNQIDTSKDRRVSLEEFEKAVPLLEQRGLKVPNAKAIFHKIDTNNGGYILFDEFCHYVIANHMEFEE
jgi:Ca2+-binding EF-hand superfamily protein